MKNIWELNPPAFEKMLDWLDKDRNTAGQKYEAMRLRLIKILQYRGCLDGEDMADVIFDRVARKIDFLTENYQGDPAYYFLNVANKVYLESLRKPETVELLPNIIESNNNNHNHHNHEETVQPEYICLKKCLDHLSPDKRKMIVDYYSESKQAKIKKHQQIASAAGIELGTLHVRAFRLRTTLQKCVLKCLGEND